MAREQTGNPPPPYPIHPAGSRYPRRVWWMGPEAIPGVALRTRVRLRPALARRKRARELLAAVTWAASAALSLHPRLNFCTFWGDLAWAGPAVRTEVILERRDQSCDSVVFSDAHRLDLAAILEVLGRPRPVPPPAGFWTERLPRVVYLLRRLSGIERREYLAKSSPLFISMLGLPGIDELTHTPAHSMALYPGLPREGELPLVLCYNHQLANARSVARFLLTIKELME